MQSGSVGSSSCEDDCFCGSCFCNSWFYRYQCWVGRMGRSLAGVGAGVEISSVANVNGEGCGAG